VGPAGDTLEYQIAAENPSGPGTGAARNVSPIAMRLALKATTTASSTSSVPAAPASPSSSGSSMPTTSSRLRCSETPAYEDFEDISGWPAMAGNEISGCASRMRGVEPGQDVGLEHIEPALTVAAEQAL
jgi:hypothetical protein